MSTLYIDQTNLEIKSTPQQIKIYAQNQLQQSIPLNVLERVIICSSVKMNSQTIIHLSAANVSLVVMRQRYQAHSARLMSTKSLDVNRRIAQYQQTQNKQQCLALSVYLMQRKLLSQIKCLNGLRQQKVSKRHALTHAIAHIKDIIKNSGSAKNLDTLRGYEGAAAALYFKALSQTFAPSLNFKGRNKRPPKDAVNACLSLAYTIVHHRLAQTLIANGLDADIGFYHQPGYKGDALASDFIELYRAKIDAWVWHLFNTRQLKNSHFKSSDDSACLLGKAGRALFYKTLETALIPTIEKSAKKIARLYVKQLSQQL